MLFNSLGFLIFYIVVTTGYFLLPHRFRWLLLLLASCVFYMAFVPVYILILLLTIIIDYAAGIFIESSTGHKRKLYLVVSIVTNVGVLAVFKYYNFFIDNINTVIEACGLHVHSLPFWSIILPIGLSFHTFQAMSYTIEVYRGNQKAERNFFIYALYVMFYPQLVAGPIERPQNLLHQFKDEHTFSYNNLLNGLRLMLWGIFKKAVIADRFGQYVDAIYAHPAQYHTAQLLIAGICFGLQLYADFSGYSDIARGCARSMGFELMINFNNPFVSLNITEFWRRWHISLSTWFNDYLYTPVIIAKRDWGNLAVVFAVLVTFFVSGFWHGANWTFVFWGGLHGIAVIYEFYTKKSRKKLAKKAPKLLYNGFSRLFTLSYLVLCWYFFRAPSIHEAFSIIHRIVTFDNSVTVFHSVAHFTMLSWLIGLAAVAYMLTVEFIVKPDLRFFETSYLYDVLFITVNLTLLIAFGVFGHATFIYFQF
jgi:alginate O-acetyltransferase complex protein AlgI